MHDHASFDKIDANLYPALIEVFAIMLLGYLSGYFRLMSSEHANGLNRFISTFALPALIFSNLATIDFSSVNWTFLGSIFFAKAIVFAVVASACLLLVKSRNLGLAAVFGIFVSQSNDFALGYPIIGALYGDTNPDYLRYVYLIAPISLCIINPVAFLMLEINDKLKRRTQGLTLSTRHFIVKVLWGTVSNPIVFMTAIALVANFVLNRHIPGFLQPTLTTLGQAFSAIALFYLGFMMVNRIKSLTLLNVIAIVTLVVIKSLIFPLVAREFMFHLSENTAESNSFSSFAFLYGTFPTAPSIFFYLNNYRQVGEDVLSPALVFGTVASAPLMMLSAKIIAMQLNVTTNMTNETVIIAERIEHFEIITHKSAFGFSILSLVCLAWVLYVYVGKRRFKHSPYTFVLIVNQVLLALVELCWSNLKPSELSYYLYAVVSTLLILSSRCLLLSITAGILINLQAMRLHLAPNACSQILAKYPFVKYFVSLGLPLLLTLVCVILSDYGARGADGEIEMIVKYNKFQLVVIIALIASVILIVTYFIVLYVKTINDLNVVELHVDANNNVGDNERRKNCVHIGNISFRDEDVFDTSADPLLNASVEHDDDDDDDEMVAFSFRDSIETSYVKFTIQNLTLVIILTLSSLLSLFFYVWELFEENKTEIFYELQILHTTFVYAQGFFTFLVFGFEPDLVIVPVLFRIKRWLKLSANDKTRTLNQTN